MQGSEARAARRAVLGLENYIAKSESLCDGTKSTAQVQGESDVVYRYHLFRPRFVFFGSQTLVTMHPAPYTPRQGHVSCLDLQPLWTGCRKYFIECVMADCKLSIYTGCR
jgi:hypothetical protein